MCWMWYRGQPVFCNICATEGHKSANFPLRNKCRLCDQEGRFADNCPNPWGTASVDTPVVNLGSSQVSDPVTPSGGPPCDVQADASQPGIPG